MVHQSYASYILTIDSNQISYSTIRNPTVWNTGEVKYYQLLSGLDESSLSKSLQSEGNFLFQNYLPVQVHAECFTYRNYDQNFNFWTKHIVYNLSKNLSSKLQNSLQNPSSAWQTIATYPIIESLNWNH